MQVYFLSLWLASLWKIQLRFVYRKDPAKFVPFNDQISLLEHLIRPE